MSFLASNLAKGIVAVLAGTAIIAPTAYSLSRQEEKGEEKFKLEKDNLKSYCVVVLEGNGEGDDEESGNKRLLACQSSLNTKTHTNFYVWTKGNSEELPKEINQAKLESEEAPKKLILTLASPSDTKLTDTILISSGDWNFLNGLNLKEKCRINFSEETKKLTCKLSTGGEKTTLLSNMKHLINDL